MHKPKTAAMLMVIVIVLAGCGNEKEQALVMTDEEAVAIPIVEIVEQKLPYEPVDITYKDEKIIKTFVVPQAADLYTLVEEPFTEGDHSYEAIEIQKKTVPGDIETKMITKTIPVDVPNDNQAEALAWYSPELDYSDEEGFVGRVQLNPDTLTIEANGTKKYSYQITDSKQFLNLVRNDPSSIPQTTTKNGRTLELVNVDWQVADQAMAGDSLIATRYNAIAHYAATAQGTRVTGYTANAVYTGEISRQGASQISCSVIYEGKLTAQSLLKRLVIPFLVAALILAIAVPEILRRRKLHMIQAEAHKAAGGNASVDNEQRENGGMEQRLEETLPKYSRVRAWREKRKNRQPIFVEMLDDEEGEPGKAKIYLPKEEEEGEQHEGI